MTRPPRAATPHASILGRRRLLGLAAGGVAAGLIATACGGDDDPTPATATTAPTAATSAPATATTAPPAAAEQGTVLVGDVLDHALSSDQWSGQFGFVTFRLHTASIDGEPAYFIRTDASDEAFAGAEKLVFVPKLAKALDTDAGYGDLYLVEGGAADQRAVISTAPHRDDYTPLFRIHRVTVTGGGAALDSADAVRAAEAGGSATIDSTDIVVNYPVVKWPGGELPHDTVREAYLGDGQLIEPVDVAGEQVTFKLHACYPNSRYIVTDVSAPPMAGGMNIAPSPASAVLTDAGATAQILVFGNGLVGSGPMGFQKSITDTLAGEPAWSPLWDHYTFVWKDAGAATLLQNNGEVLAQEDAGALERFPGTPDTNGQIFVVNCPVPVTAPLA